MKITLNTDELRQALAELLGDGAALPTDEELEEFAERRAARQAAPPVPAGLARNRRDWILDWSIQLIPSTRVEVA